MGQQKLERLNYLYLRITFNVICMSFFFNFLAFATTRQNFLLNVHVTHQLLKILHKNFSGFFSQVCPTEDPPSENF